MHETAVRGFGLGPSRSRSHPLTHQLTRICKASFCITESKQAENWVWFIQGRQCYLLWPVKSRIGGGCSRYKEVVCESACRDLKEKGECWWWTLLKWVKVFQNTIRPFLPTFLLRNWSQTYGTQDESGARSQVDITASSEHQLRGTADLWFPLK